MELRMYHKLNYIITCLFCMLFAANATAEVLHCEAMLPKTLQIPAIDQCNQKIVYVPQSEEKYYNTPLFDANLTEMVLKNNNFGASIFFLPNHEKKIVYRSANLAGSPLCLYTLVNKYHVKTIINLISTETGHGPQLKILEESLFQTIGGQNYIHILNYQVTPGITIINDNLFQNITNIIKQIINTDGDVLVHCLAGAHDTGTVFGIMQKCYNKLPIDMIKKNAACHMGSQNYSYQKKVFDLVSQIIDQYPCSLLQN